MPSLDDTALDQLFRAARTHRSWRDQAVSDDELRAIYQAARFAPTGSNSNPLRVAFVRSPEAKERLRPALDAGNVGKTMSAPATALLAFDGAFYDQLPRLVPHRDERTAFANNPAMAEEVARFSATLQIGYFLLAARALGLDCGPMGGFDRAMVDEAFFAGTAWRSLLLMNLGHGDPAKLHPRQPRLDFEDACRIV